MSIARGDLARRAALADTLAVPEPWGANDDPRVFSAIRDLRDEFRRLGITDEDGKGRLPDFLLDYEHLPPIKPTTLDRAHNRNSSATRWDQNGNLVEDSSDTLRLQRDPKTQEPLGLLYEPKRTQLLDAPTDLTQSDWGKSNSSVNGSVGSAKGQSYDELVEDSQDSSHGVFQSFSGPGTDDPVAHSYIVKSVDRRWCHIAANATNTGAYVRAWFDLQNGVTGSVTDDGGGTPGGTTIDHSIQDLGDGWYRIRLVQTPPSGETVDDAKLRLATGDQVTFYQGDGTSGIFVMHAQTEVSREVTTPILTGSATRGADAVNYGFSFPDRTTGVAYSIEQQAGGDYGSSYGWGKDSIIVMGTTSNDNLKHGALMYRAGLNNISNDGWKQVTRNSDDDDSFRLSPLDETIDRFLVNTNQRGNPGASYIIRQVAIHTRPHTQAQKSALADQYLTQP